MTGVAKWFATTHSHSQSHARDRRPPTPPPPLPVPLSDIAIEKEQKRTRRWSWRHSHSTAKAKGDEVTRSQSASNLLSLSLSPPAPAPTPSHSYQSPCPSGLPTGHPSLPLTSVAPSAGAPPSSFAFPPRTPKRHRLHVPIGSEPEPEPQTRLPTYPPLSPPSPLSPPEGGHSAPRPSRKTLHHLPRALSQQQLGSVRRRRAPSSSSPQPLLPQHPNGQTRFKPGTRPTWRFLKNLRSPVHLPAPTSANGKPKMPRKDSKDATKEPKCKDKDKVSKRSNESKEDDENKSHSHPTSRRASPLLSPALDHAPDGAITTDWETDDGHPTERPEGKPRRSFSLRIRSGRKAKPPGTGEGVRSPPPSPTPSRSASPTRHLGMGTFGLGRPKRWSEPVRPRTASPALPPLPAPGMGMANRLPSSGTLMTFATSSSSPSSVDSSLPSSNPLSIHTLSRPTSPSSPLSHAPLATAALGAVQGQAALARIDSVSAGPRRQSAPTAANGGGQLGKMDKQRKRASNTQNMVLSIALGCAIALSPRLAVGATLLVLLAAMCLAALVRVLALPRVWVEAGSALRGDTPTGSRKRTTSETGQGR